MWTPQCIFSCWVYLINVYDIHFMHMWNAINVYHKISFRRSRKKKKIFSYFSIFINSKVTVTISSAFSLHEIVNKKKRWLNWLILWTVANKTYSSTSAENFIFYGALMIILRIGQLVFKQWFFNKKLCIVDNG